MVVQGCLALFGNVRARRMNERGGRDWTYYPVGLQSSPLHVFAMRPPNS